jgi:hypothetical protein
MKIPILALLAALAGAGCQLSPVITTPEPRQSDRYDDCRRAAEEYCHHARKAPESEMDRCVADAVYSCVSGKERSG